jgi:signal transduction histidine kinase
MFTLVNDARTFAAGAAGLGGAALLAVTAAPAYDHGPLGPSVVTAWSSGQWGFSKVLLVAVLLMTAAGLCLPRYWPYVLVTGGVLGLPYLATELVPAMHRVPHIEDSYGIGAPLVALGVLGCAQGLIRGGKTGWGAGVGAATVGAAVFGASLSGPTWLTDPPLTGWHVGLTAIGLVAVLPAVWWWRLGDPAAVRGVRLSSWARLRYVLTGTAAVAIAITVPVILTPYRIQILLDVSEAALARHRYVISAVVGLTILVGAAVCAAVGGFWSLAGGLTAATVQVAAGVPILLGLYTMAYAGPSRWIVALIGVVVGVAAAATRWRVPIACGLTVLSAGAMFVAVAATGGRPEKLADQHKTVAVAMLFVLVAATVTATTGAVAVMLARRGAAPAVLGPILAGLVIGAGPALGATYLTNGMPESSYLNPLLHLNTSALLMLVAGAALGALGFVEFVVARRLDRRAAEALRREAAEQERNRLARPIHDGVLQVLALVQRHGADLGTQGAELAALAGEQEVALRTLLTTGTGTDSGGKERADLRSVLGGLASPAIEVSAPADPVELPALAAREIRAAVVAALDNVRRHAGPGARAWVLVEDEPTGVRVTVRDDGTGIPAHRLAEAAAAGRLGVAQSVRGRIAELGGTTTITSAPGDGTEVELFVPR